jgi:predicted HTH transcriptional regulator
MNSEQNMQRDQVLVHDLLRNADETEIVEFKENNADPKAIGKLISALANAACLKDQCKAYILWGISDVTKQPVGTQFDPNTKKMGGEPLAFWLSKQLKPSITFDFRKVNYNNFELWLLEIPAVLTMPVEFEGRAYIRIGSATPRLADYPEYTQKLWQKIQSHQWETSACSSFLTSDDVLARLDYPRYFELTKQPLPDNRAGIFDKLLADRLIEQDVGEHWNITNLGAILFAKNLDRVSSPIARKAIRFVAYVGKNRASAVSHRQDGVKGYASGFEGLLDYMNALLPNNEHIGSVFREESPLYPQIAIRELVANALIHQDMTMTGAGPLIEMFSDRIEITNPGKPLMDPERFLDYPPRSRNEILAKLMRRMNFCEEQGTGIDKVLVEVELHQLPPPDFRVENDCVRAVLYAPRQFADMTPEERVRACYQHAALKWVSGERMKNNSLCERFGIDATKNAAQATKIINQALEKGLIKAADPERPRAGYYPYWA